ncbi:MAG: response regulator, partial [Pseudomonadota bacterium]
GLDARLPCLVLNSAGVSPDLGERPVELQRKPLRQRALREAVRRLLGLAVAKNARMAAGDGPEVPDLAGRRLLVAEDNKTNRLVLRKMLAPTKAKLTFAENGEEAVQAFRGDRFDLILMDVSMPVLNGHQATQAIRKIEAERQAARRCPVVAITAHAMPEDHQDCLDAGMDHVLTKPVRKRELFERLGEVLTAPEPLADLRDTG